MKREDCCFAIVHGVANFVVCQAVYHGAGDIGAVAIAALAVIIIGLNAYETGVRHGRGPQRCN